VALLTYPEMAPVVERLAPWIDELVPFPGYPGIPERPRRAELLPGFLARMRARGFDLAIQMYGAPPVLTRLTEALGARRTAGFFDPRRIEADPRRHLPYPWHEHEIRRHLRLLELLGAPSRGEELELPVRHEDEAEWQELREAVRSGDGPYACLHPGATSPSRRWPPARFAEVGDALAGRGLRVVLTGTREEAPLTRAVADRMRAPTVDVAGRTRLGAFAAALRGAVLLVGNDTGAAHLAAAVATRSVTVFLSGDPRRWAHDPRRHRVARVQVECNPCGHLTCPTDHRCAERLPSAEVLRQVAELMDRSPGRRERR
jgi:ADP-heptose:LPS heptosyltransferase